jgi:Domain of unknown function (DUF4349)
MRWVWLVFALLSAGVIGCGNQKNSVSDKAAVVSAMTELEAPPAAQAPAPADGFMAVNEERAKFAPGAVPDAISRVPSRKLIRTVQLDVVVAEVDSTSRAMQALAIEAGGYVAQVDAHLENGVPHARVSLRVPVDRLDDTLVALRKLSVRIEREQQNVQDVTEQWVDLDARLRTLQATEKELLALLAESRQRGQKLQDIMAVYRELTGIRSQIEQLEGQLKSLDQLAALSAIDVTLRPEESSKPVVAQGWRPGDSMRQSFRMLVSALTGIANLAIFLAITVLPIAALIAVPAFWLVRRTRRRVAA